MITELSSLQSNLLLICTDNWWQSHTISAHSSLLKTILKKDCRTPGRSDKLTETYLAVVKWSEGKHISSLQQSKMIKLSWLPARHVEHDLVDLSFMSSSPAGQTGTTYSLSGQKTWAHNRSDASQITALNQAPAGYWLKLGLRCYCQNVITFHSEGAIDISYAILVWHNWFLCTFSSEIFQSIIKF